MACGTNSAPLMNNATEDSDSSEQFSDRDIMKVDYMQFDKDFIAWSEACPHRLSASNSAQTQTPDSMASSCELNEVDKDSISNRLPACHGNVDSEVNQEKEDNIRSVRRGTDKNKLDFAFRLITAGHQSLNNDLILAEKRTVHVKSFVPHSAETYTAPSAEALLNNNHSKSIYKNKSMAMTPMGMMIKNRSFRKLLEPGKETLLQLVDEQRTSSEQKEITADHTLDTCIAADNNLNHESAGKYFRQKMEPVKEIRFEVLNKERNSYKVIGTGADHTVATSPSADNIIKSNCPFAITSMEQSYDKDSNVISGEAEHRTVYMNFDNNMEIDIAEETVSTSCDRIRNSDSCKTYENETNNSNVSTGLVQRENVCDLVAKSGLQYGVLGDNAFTANKDAYAINKELDFLPSTSMTPSSVVDDWDCSSSSNVNCHKERFKITTPCLKYLNKLDKLKITVDDDIVTRDYVYVIESKKASADDNTTKSVSNLKRIYQKVWTRNQFNVAKDHTYSYDGTDLKTLVEREHSYISGSKYFVRKSYI